MNMYTYCGNNPVNRADPSGMFWKKIVNTVKNIVLKVVNVITSSATKLITTIIDTKYEKNITNKIDEFGPVGNVANKMNDYSNMQKDKTTHTKNVIGIGTQGSTYKVEPFINKKLIINEQKYIEQCANIFSNVELLAMTTMSIDVHSLQKGDIERMSQNILSWDASMNDRFIDVYYKELIKDGLNDVYSP